MACMKINSYDCLLIVDFGSQVTQLIARRLRELNVYCEIHPYQNVNQNLLKRLSPKAIILSWIKLLLLEKVALKDFD